MMPYVKGLQCPVFQYLVNSAAAERAVEFGCVVFATKDFFEPSHHASEVKHMATRLEC
jgi:hypothetical protein